MLPEPAGPAVLSPPALLMEVTLSHPDQVAQLHSPPHPEDKSAVPGTDEGQELFSWEQATPGLRLRELTAVAPLVEIFEKKQARNHPLPGVKLLSPALTLNVLGHVIVDDHRYILDVDTTTRHICSHQNILGPSLEVG